MTSRLEMQNLYWGKTTVRDRDDGTEVCVPQSTGWVEGRMDGWL